jgi:hypothetical protein
LLVAAASYANGIKHFDASNNEPFANALFRCLSMLLQYDVHPKMDVTMLKGQDRQLLDMAYAVFEKPNRGSAVAR